MLGILFKAFLLYILYRITVGAFKAFFTYRALKANIKKAQFAEKKDFSSTRNSDGKTFEADCKVISKSD